MSGQVRQMMLREVDRENAANAGENPKLEGA